MQQKIERLQDQLGDQKGISKDTLCVSDTLDPLSHKLENENVELEFQVLNYAKENAHLKTIYKNLFDYIKVSEQKDTSKGVNISTKSRMPQPRSNTKNDRAPSAFKSSWIMNKEVGMIILKVVCAMCKQCLITANHDVCVLNYVNGMNSHGTKQKANVSNIENQQKQKPQVKKAKKVSKASLAPSEPSICRR
ncbi:hypothetical protein Tco_1371678 [Tanacetum coccineum]